MTDTQTEQTEFTFEELSEKAKDKVRSSHAENLIHEWWGDTYEYFKERGHERGFELDSMHFRGFWSQGDGAMWTGEVRLKEFITYHLRDTDPDHHRYTVLLMLLEEDYIDGRINVEQRGFYYSHSGCMQFETSQQGMVYDLASSDEDTLHHDCVLKGANVYQLAEGIQYEELLAKLDEWIEKEARGYADELYDALEKEHEFLTSDEAITDSCDINGYRFTEDGDLI